MSPRIAPRDLRRRLDDLASAQHGVVSLAQLQAVGFSYAQVRHRVDAGHWKRLYEGVYYVGAGAHGRRSTWMAAVLAAGPGAVLTGPAAAELWGLTRIPARTIDVAGPRTPHHVLGARVHRSRWFGRNDRTTRDGIPIASPMRTIVDLAELVDPYELIGPLHQAARIQLLRTRQLDIVRGRLRNRRHGHRALTFALGQLHAGSTGILSYAELVLVQGIRRHELPLPMVNVVIDTPRGKFKVDLYWPELHLVVEVDDPGHELTAARRLDAARDEALAHAGIRVIRVPNELVFEQLDEVLEHLERACAAATSRG